MSQSKPKPKMCVDEIDRKITNSLQENCRLSINKVAARTGISVGTAYNRIKSLEAHRIVKDYTLVIDYAKLGYVLTVLIFVYAEGAHLKAVEK